MQSQDGVAAMHELRCFLRCGLSACWVGVWDEMRVAWMWEERQLLVVQRYSK